MNKPSLTSLASPNGMENSLKDAIREEGEGPNTEMKSSVKAASKRSFKISKSNSKSRAIKRISRPSMKKNDPSLSISEANRLSLQK